MRPAIFSLIIVTLSLCLSSSAFAVNLSFLRNSPLANMSKEAYEEFKVAVIYALDNEADGYTLDWTSSVENSSARVLILNTYELDERHCRKLKTELTVNNLNGRSILHICKDQAWQLRASPIGGFSKADWAFLSKEVDYTLAEVPDGVPNSWIIPESRTSGTLVPVKSEYDDSGFCRSVSVSIHLRTGELLDDVVRFCRDTDGKWKRHSKWRDQD